MKLEDGYIKVDIYDLFSGMSDEQKREFLTSVTWTDEVFEDMKTAIMENYATSSYDYNIHMLREHFLKESGILTRKYMEAMLRDLDKAKKDADYYRNALWETQRFVTDQQDGIPWDDRIKTKEYRDYPTADWNIEKYVEKLFEIKKEEELTVE